MVLLATETPASQNIPATLMNINDPHTFSFGDFSFALISVQGQREGSSVGGVGVKWSICAAHEKPTKLADYSLDDSDTSEKERMKEKKKMKMKGKKRFCT